jgi:polyvinyl alcohol dehydrogenase (cytochrome)
MTAANGILFVPMFDYENSASPIDPMEGRPGLHALDAFTGAPIWSTIAENNCGNRRFCSPGISSPATAFDGFVIAGHSDGILRAYDSETGAVIWEMQTDREFESLNQLPARGGSMGGGTGPVVVDGMLYFNSGYSSLRHMPGNALIAARIVSE